MNTTNLKSWAIARAWFHWFRWISNQSCTQSLRTVWSAVGSYGPAPQKFGFISWLDELIWPPWRNLKADVSSVSPSSFKLWPKGIASYRKMETCGNLRLRLAMACEGFRWFAMTCVHVERAQKFHTSKRKFLTVWSPNASRRKLPSVLFWAMSQLLQGLLWFAEKAIHQTTKQWTLAPKTIELRDTKVQWN